MPRRGDQFADGGGNLVGRGGLLLGAGRLLGGGRLQLVGGALNVLDGRADLPLEGAREKQGEANREPNADSADGEDQVSHHGGGRVRLLEGLLHLAFFQVDKAGNRRADLAVPRDDLALELLDDVGEAPIGPAAP